MSKSRRSTEISRAIRQAAVEGRLFYIGFVENDILWAFSASRENLSLLDDEDAGVFALFVAEALED